jgi:nucleotide-binding universal stress UspA family protein
MYQRIVVGTDGSATASTAVDHAARLAASVGATLHVLHAYKPMSALVAMDPSFPHPDPTSVQAGRKEHAQSICVQAAERAHAAGARVETHVAATGDPADALVALAEDVGADLIVVGSKGMAGARRFITGSVPNRIAHHCPCHLLVVSTT